MENIKWTLLNHYFAIMSSTKQQHHFKLRRIKRIDLENLSNRMKLAQWKSGGWVHGEEKYNSEVIALAQPLNPSQLPWRRGFRHLMLPITSERIHWWATWSSNTGWNEIPRPTNNQTEPFEHIRWSGVLFHCRQHWSWKTCSLCQSELSASAKFFFITEFACHGPLNWMSYIWNSSYPADGWKNRKKKT